MNFKEKKMRGESVYDWRTGKTGYYVGSYGDIDLFYFGNPKSPGADDEFQKMCDDFDQGDAFIVQQHCTQEMLSCLKDYQKEMMDWLDFPYDEDC